MKRLKKFFWAAVTTSVGGGLAFGATTLVSFDPNQTIPDADANGVALVGNVGGLSGTISDLTVSFNVTNGFNGDLYASLTGPNGGFAILLNRVGVSNNATAFGYSDSGFNVTFADANANDVHLYRNSGYALNTGGQLTGGWKPDGRNVDPASAPSVLGATSPTAFLNSFNGTDPNGNWVLFLADFSNGSQSTVKNWTLNITTVPEPNSLALASMCLVLRLLANNGRKRKIAR